MLALLKLYVDKFKKLGKQINCQKNKTTKFMQGLENLARPVSMEEFIWKSKVLSSPKYSCLDDFIAEILSFQGTVITV